MGIFQAIKNWVFGLGKPKPKPEEPQPVPEKEKEEEIDTTDTPYETPEPVKEEKPEKKTKKPKKKRAKKEVSQSKPVKEKLQKKLSKEKPSKRPTKTEILKKIESAPQITAIQETIGKNNRSEIKFIPSRNLSDKRTVYEQLLRNSSISVIDKNGNVDTALLDILIENRRKLQHRFTATIEIITDKSKGSMEIAGILAEDCDDIYNYINTGETYSSQELKERMQQAMVHFEQTYGSIGGMIIPPNEEKSTITGIDIKLTFA